MPVLPKLALFRRAAAVEDACELGRTAVALPLRSGCAAPSGCQVVIVDAGGRTRRAPVRPAQPLTPARKSMRIELRGGELAWVFHPGPYTADIVPFAAAPEIGLRTRFTVDAPDAGVAQPRFDLYLAAEVAGSAGRLPLAGLAGAMQAALRRELAQGGLDLPPCTTVEEWHAFRQGLDQLFYLRFGITVDDCVPADLCAGSEAEGGAHDHAALLRARAAAAPGADAMPLEGAGYGFAAGADAGAVANPVGPARADPAAGSAPASAPGAAQVPVPAGAAPADPALADARALRRLFLELPCLMCALRLAALPPGRALFRRQQELLARLDLLSVAAGAMPALALAAPGQPIGPEQQRRRVRHSLRAAASLDEAWALLARMGAAGSASAAARPAAGAPASLSAPPAIGQDAGALAALYDEADRILANLEADCAARRDSDSASPAAGEDA